MTLMMSHDVQPPAGVVTANVFGNLAEVVALSRRLVEYLVAATGAATASASANGGASASASGGFEESCVGDCFLQLSEALLGVYREYCWGHEDAVAYIAKVRLLLLLLLLLVAHTTDYALRAAARRSKARSSRVVVLSSPINQNFTADSSGALSLRAFLSIPGRDIE